VERRLPDRSVMLFPGAQEAAAARCRAAHEPFSPCKLQLGKMGRRSGLDEGPCARFPPPVRKK
jgi:hypothetical protein